jgi:ATP-binding cassette subfamily B protein
VCFVDSVVRLSQYGSQYLIAGAIRLVFGKRMTERNQDFRSEIERMSSNVAEMINMIPVVRAYGLEDEATGRMEAHFLAVNRRGRRLDLVNAVFASSSWMSFQLAMVAALAVLVWFCRRGLITVGDIVLYQSLFGMMVNCVSQLLGI